METGQACLNTGTIRRQNVFYVLSDVRQADVLIQFQETGCVAYATHRVLYAYSINTYMLIHANTHTHAPVYLYHSVLYL